MRSSSRILGCLLVMVSVGFATGAIAQEATAPPIEASHRLDLNHATVDELCTLPGIGKKRAQTIVDYRTKRPFTRLTQLLRVRGIGKKTLRRLKPLLRVDRPKPVRSNKAAKNVPKRPVSARKAEH